MGSDAWWRDLQNILGRCWFRSWFSKKWSEWSCRRCFQKICYSFVQKRSSKVLESNNLKKNRQHNCQVYLQENNGERNYKTQGRGIGVEINWKRRRWTEIWWSSSTWVKRIFTEKDFDNRIRRSRCKNLSRDYRKNEGYPRR